MDFYRAFIACPILILSIRKMSSSVKLFRDQSYQELKEQCLQQGQLFEDPEFPASDESLYYDSSAKGKVEWKRPKVMDGCVFSPVSSSRDTDTRRVFVLWGTATLSLSCFSLVLERFPLLVGASSALCMAVLNSQWVLPLTCVKPQLPTSDFLCQMSRYYL